MPLRRSTSSFRFNSLSPASLTAPSTSSQPSDSLIARLILAPVLFVGFLLSLVLIDRATVSNVFRGRPEKDAYYHSHQRKLAKHDINEAWVRKNRVIIGMCVASAVLVAMLGLVGARLWEFLLKA